MTDQLKLLASILIASVLVVVLLRQIDATMRPARGAPTEDEHNPGCTMLLIIVAIVGFLIGVGVGW